MRPVLHGRRRQAWSAFLLFAWVVGLAASASGQSDPLCPHIVACEYEAPAFTIRVVDQQTGQPLADVHAIASWVFYGGPRRRGLLMVLEAVSGPDGWISFGGWGPVRSGVEGLLPGNDPLISLFRPGYRAQFVYNATPLGQPHTVRVHAFDQAGQTFELMQVPLAPAETIAELWKAVDPFEGATLSQFDSPSIRRAYLNRLRRVRVEAERLPRHLPDHEHLLWAIDSGIRLFESGGG
jgi:hypothetical protein